MKYRKRPIEVEAEQFNLGESLPFDDPQVRDRLGLGRIVHYCGKDSRHYVITIHDQWAYLDDGDWVILEPRGCNQAYPCKPDVFENTYDLAD